MRIIVFILLVLLFQETTAEQYRSKLFLDPGKQLSESSQLSLKDLEQQINSMSNAYSKSTAGRYLARHYVKEKNYVKAIEYYRTALSAEGLSDVVNDVLLKELAGIYVLNKQYKEAITSLNQRQQLNPAKQDTTTTILRAQAYYGLSDYLSLVEALDEIMPQLNTLSDEQLKQMLGLYYKAGSYSQSEKILQALINRDPQMFSYWQQLTSIFLMQNKHKRALDQLSLARQKSLPFSDKDILLLADLYVANNVPEKGARLFEQAIAEGEIENNEKHNKRLFEYWLQAREKKKAAETLNRSIKLIQDFELFIRLAQLQREQEDWLGMHNTMLVACQKTLDDKYVSRANLLLGVSQLKLGDKASARKSFINSTLISGAGNKAQAWLEYIHAAQPESDELQRITGLCHPQDRKVRYVKLNTPKSAVVIDKTPSTSEDAITTVNTKTVRSQSLYGLKLSVEPEDLASSIKNKAFSTGVSLVKTGGTINGPLHLLFDEVLAEGEPVKFRLAFPYKGKPKNKGPYRAKKAAEFKCAYVNYTGPASEILSAWVTLYKQTKAAGFTSTGESRMVLRIDDSVGTAAMSFELQLGIF